MSDHDGMMHDKQFTHWPLQEAKHTDCLQKIIQIIMERRRFCGVHIRVKSVNTNNDWNDCTVPLACTHVPFDCPVTVDLGYLVIDEFEHLSKGLVLN